MPIVQSDTLYGLICAFNRDPRAWKSWEIETLREVSTQVGNAIKQARLYRQCAAAQTPIWNIRSPNAPSNCRRHWSLRATLKRITDRCARQPGCQPDYANGGARADRSPRC